MYTDNNPLTYVKGGKLGVTQIWWFSKLGLFDFDIKYRTGKSNQAADALSHCPKPIEDNFGDNDSEDYETILYDVVCDDLCEIIKGQKLPLDIKRAVQAEITKRELLQDIEKTNMHSKMVDILSNATPGMMKKAQEDLDINTTICYVKSCKKPTLAQIQMIKSGPIHCYLCQFDQLVFCQEYCTECSSMMGPSTTNSFYQLGLGSRYCHFSIMNKVISQWSICCS